MKRVLYSVVMLLVLFITGCSDSNQYKSSLPQIDMNAKYPEKEICLQDVAEVSYIPLETTDDFLLTDVASMEMVSSKGIVCVSDEKVLLFHPDGKVRSLLNRKGEGPGEYRYVHYATLDWEREEIYIHDIHQKTMLVYSFDGNFKHQFDIDIRARQHDMLCDNDGHIVLYKERPGRMGHGMIEPPYRPIVLISKADGKIDSLLHQQDFYTTMFVKAKLANGGDWTLDVPIQALVKLNNEVYVNEVASDTIYQLKGADLEPFVCRTPSIKDNESGKYLLQLKGIIPNHYYFHLQTKELSGGSSSGMTIQLSDENSKNAMYDTRIGKLFCPKFINRDYTSEFSYDGLTFDGCDANTAYMEFEAFDLIEALEAGELHGNLKVIAEGLKEDDNPVLMVVKFKE